MKILIPGGTGFIGTHLSKKLLGLGYEFAIMSRGLLTPSKDLSEVKIYHGDITNFSDVDKIVSGFRPDIIVDLADALYTLTRDPRDYIKTNVIGLVNLLEAIKQNKSKLIFISTCGVYGNIEGGKANEEYRINPQSPYEISKFAGERYCLYYHRFFKTPMLILRVFNVYGPGQKPDSKGGVIATFITRALNDQPPIVSGKGNQTRDFVFIDDLVDILVKTLDSDVSGEIINVCSGKDMSMLNLANKIIELCGKKSMKPEFTPPRENEIIRSVGDNSKAKKLLNWEPKVDIDNGLSKTIEHFKNLQIS